MLYSACVHVPCCCWRSSGPISSPLCTFFLVHFTVLVSVLPRLCICYTVFVCCAFLLTWISMLHYIIPVLEVAFVDFVLLDDVFGSVLVLPVSGFSLCMNCLLIAATRFWIAASLIILSWAWNSLDLTSCVYVVLSCLNWSRISPCTWIDTSMFCICARTYDAYTDIL